MPLPIVKAPGKFFKELVNLLTPANGGRRKVGHGLRWHRGSHCADEVNSPSLGETFCLPSFQSL